MKKARNRHQAILNTDEGMDAIMLWLLGFGRTMLFCLVFSLGYCLAGGLAGGIIGVIGWGDDAFVTGASYGAGVIGVGLLPGILLILGSCIHDSSPNETAGDILLNLQIALILCGVFALISGLAGGFLGGIVGIIFWGWADLSSAALIGAGIGAGLAPVFLLCMLTRKN